MTDFGLKYHNEESPKSNIDGSGWLAIATGVGSLSTFFESGDCMIWDTRCKELEQQRMELEQQGLENEASYLEQMLGTRITATKMILTALVIISLIIGLVFLLRRRKK